MFVDEDQWSRAYAAAKAEVELLSNTDGMPELTPWQRNRLAVRIATVALRAAAQDDSGDISTVPGVSVAEIDNHTVTYRNGPPRSSSSRGPLGEGTK